MSINYTMVAVIMLFVILISIQFTLNKIFMILKEIKEMIKGDDIEVINIYRESCRYLGYGIVNIVNTYNPTVIILGDELTHVDQEIMLNEVDKVLKERLLPEIYEKLTVKISGAVKDSVLHGIGAMCTKKVFDNYSMFF